MSKPLQTNALRLLTAAKIPFRTIEYPLDDALFDGMAVARHIGMEPEMVFKTLVVQGEKQGPFVCCIPVCCELNLKAAAAVMGEKKVALYPLSGLLGLTGYVRGGCSPVGMKKRLPTFFHESALTLAEIALSAGARGCQMILDPRSLIAYIGGKTAFLTENK